jgi:hypothetical protein
MKIRTIKESDSEQFLLLGKALDGETQFMMLEPGERTLTIEEQTQRIQAFSPRQSDDFVVEHEPTLILGAWEVSRNRHCAYIVIAIRRICGSGIVATAERSNNGR